MRKILLLILALVLAGCSTSSPEVTPTQAVQGEGEVTAPTEGPSTPYPQPAGTPEATPTEEPAPTFEEVLPTEESDALGPDFTVEPPIEVGVAQIKGTGPAGVPIVLIDTDDGGKELAKTTIGADGRFTLDVAGKLVEAHLIGIKLGDVSGTQIDPKQFEGKSNYNEDALYGTIFVLIEVEPAGGGESE